MVSARQTSTFSSQPSTGNTSSGTRGFERVCEKRLHETAKRLVLMVHAMAFGPDHVHVFVKACINNSVAEVVRRLKGASSRWIRRECWIRVKTWLWGEAFWSGKYFYRSVGSTTGEAIQNYIENSQRKHFTTLEYEEYIKRRADHHKPVRHVTLKALALSSLDFQGL